MQTMWQCFIQFPQETMRFMRIWKNEQDARVQLDQKNGEDALKPNITNTLGD